MTNIYLKQIIYLNQETQMRLLDIRNEEAVRKWMFTDRIITPDEHLAWINKLKQEEKDIIFAIIYNNTLIGSKSINSIDLKNKKAEMGSYLTNSFQGLGISPIISFHFLDFYFYTLGFEKLNTEVIEGNSGVVYFHKYFFFREEGFRRSDILKEGKRIGVHCFGLTKEDWGAGKLELQKKYYKIMNQFSVEIDNRNLYRICNIPPPPPPPPLTSPIQYQLIVLISSYCGEYAA